MYKYVYFDALIDSIRERTEAAVEYIVNAGELNPHFDGENDASNHLFDHAEALYRCMEQFEVLHKNHPQALDDFISIIVEEFHKREDEISERIREAKE